MNKNKLKYRDGKAKVYKDEFKKEINELDEYIDKNKVTNIGVLGPFSSGKSSFIETYKSKHNKKRILKVSLGKFNKDLDEPKPKENCTNSIIYYDYDLELSILEQLILAKHPQKMWSKDGFLVKLFKIISIICSFLFLFYLLKLLDVNLINAIYQQLIVSTNINKYINKFTPFLNKSFTIISFIGFLSITYLIFKIIFLVITGNLFNKIKYENMEINIDVSVKESLVDKNIKTLINVFNNLKASIVVFEDLDRFNNINNILRKLKELNEIINVKKRKRYFFKNCKRDDRLIFIYAISQEEIKEVSNRAKFFDASILFDNVLDKNKLEEEIKKDLSSHGIEFNKLNTNLLTIIKENIRDMRVLNFFLNDFNRNLNKDNLKKFNDVMAISLYKVIDPEDYNKILNNHSLIDKLFNNKLLLINEHTKNIKKEIESNQKLINEIEDKVENNINELTDILERKIEKEKKYLRVEIIDNYQFENEKIKMKHWIKNRYNSYEVSTTDYSLDKTTFDNFRKRYENINENRKKEYMEINYKNQKKINQLTRKSLQEILYLVNSENRKKYYEQNGLTNENRLVKQLIENGLIKENYQEIIFQNKVKEFNNDDIFIHMVRSDKNNKEELINYKINNPSYVLNELSNNINIDSFNFNLLKYITLNQKNITVKKNEYAEKYKEAITHYEDLDLLLSSYNKNKVHIDRFSYFISENKNIFNSLSELTDRNLALEIVASIINISTLKYIKDNKKDIYKFLEEMDLYLSNYFSMYNTKEISEKLKIFKFEKLLGKDDLIKQLLKSESFIINEENIKTYFNNKSERQKETPFTTILNDKHLSNYFISNIDKVVLETLNVIGD